MTLSTSLPLQTSCHVKDTSTGPMGATHPVSAMTSRHLVATSSVILRFSLFPTP